MRMAGQGNVRDTCFSRCPPTQVGKLRHGAGSRQLKLPNGPLPDGNPFPNCPSGLELTRSRLLRVCQRACVAMAWSSSCLMKDCKFPKTVAACTNSSRVG